MVHEKPKIRNTNGSKNQLQLTQTRFTRYQKLEIKPKWNPIEVKLNQVESREAKTLLESEVKLLNMFFK